MSTPILSRLRVRTRIWLLIGLAIVFMSGREVLVLYTLDQEIWASRQAKINQLVDVALSTLDHFHKQENLGIMTRAAAQQSVIDILKILRYQRDDYFWILDLQPKMIMHPFKPELNGKDLSDFTDPAGKKLFVAMVEQVKVHGQGFVAYMWPKPGMEKPVPKLSFVKEFTPWGWIIGTGLYMDDMQTLFWSQARSILVIFMSIVLLLLVSAYSLARSIIIPINHISEHITRMTAGDLTTRIEGVLHGRGEISRIGQQINLLTENWLLEKTERQQSEKELRIAYLALKRQNESRLAINSLHETMFEHAPIEKQLQIVLDVIFSLPWFDLQPKGAVFLLNRESELVLSAHKNFAGAQRVACGRIQPGQCLCGKAFLTKELIFSPCVDERHDIRLENMEPHGHYCVPIMDGDQCLGVINLYVPPNHVPTEEEREFLITASNTITGLIKRRSLEEQLDQQAKFDHLTGLPNRALFQAQLAREIRHAKRAEMEVVLMFIDLDKFKAVNDTLGHKAGDKLLKEAALRIKGCVRHSDMVARLGGDEFTVIISRLTHPFYVEFVARRILEELAKPFLLVEGNADISGSIGITVFPHDAPDMEQLLKNADTAMYYAKGAGRATFRFFEERMTTAAMERLEVERALKQALENNEFVLHYQPKVDPDSGQTVGMEALVRWQRPHVGLVPPDSFIQIAEQTGLISAIGAHVLKLACRQNKAWIDSGRAPLCVSVNLSTRQFLRGEELLATIKNTLEETGLPPECLELEITESMMMENMDEAVIIIEKIKTLGVKISVDDFGTGYSSLSSLKNLPIQTLKIDRSFITGLADDSDSIAIVSAIISLAKKLNLRVVAEGVESIEQLEFLKSQGCDEIQGFFYAKPMSVDDFEKFLDVDPTSAC